MKRVRGGGGERPPPRIIKHLLFAFLWYIMLDT